MSNRSRGWCFTWNNYPADHESSLNSVECRYIIFGRETAPDTGTPHLQGYIYWDNPKALGGVRRILPGCHLSAARGNSDQNRDYCSKGGDFVERGDLPISPAQRGRNEVDRWNTIWSHAKSGNFDEIDKDILIRYYSSIKKIRMDYMPQVEPLAGVCGFWIFGLSGCGKTRAVLSAYPQAFIKPRNNWWDGYQQEEVVLLDDVDKFDRGLGGKLKHWADFAPFIAEQKGGSLRIRPKKLIVTSQYKMEDIWDDEETLLALNRRFVFIEKLLNQNIII